MPGQGFWDTGQFQTVGPLLGTAHPTGYPGYLLLGWLASLALAPLGEPAFRMNLLSAILLGAASGLVVVLVRELAGRTIIAVAAGLVLALTPIAWRIGTFADPHALHLALLAALLVLLAGWERRRQAGSPRADRWLAAAACVYALMLSNHALTTLLAPGIALFVLSVEPGILRRPRFVVGCAALLVGTAALLYLQLPIRAATGAPLVYGRPDTWQGFWYVVLAEQFRGSLVDPFGDLTRKALDLAVWAGDQLGVLAAMIPAAFVVVAVQRPRFALLTGSWLLVTCWFAASYVNADLERYYLGPLLIVVAWLGLAAGVLTDAVSRKVRVGLDKDLGYGRDDVAGQAGRPLAGLVAGVVAAALVLPALIAAPATAARVDASRDTRAADWSRWVLATLPADAVVVSWWSFSTPLWYRTLVLGERPDVRIVDDRDRLDEGLGEVEDVIRSAFPDRPVFVIRLPAELGRLRDSWHLEPLADPLGMQPLYRVVAPRPAGVGEDRPAAPTGAP
jgi:4-amino-4-deoxy-L-arabinose transferase-like glycosyltransferase